MHNFFKWIDCTDRKRPRELERPPDVKLRIAQLTDPHVPSQVELLRRVRDLVGKHGSVGTFSKEFWGMTNEMGHPYRKQRQRYTNMLKKALIGLHDIDVDHLVITGDVAHCSLPTEFLEMRGALEVTGWWGDDKLTVIPGNHDRFNLYERIPKDPMESYFDVVSPHEPRLKLLDGGVALVETESNRDPDEDAHFSEKWLPNTIGRIYEEVPEFIAEHQDELRGRRVIGLTHHHISSDWYPKGASTIGGLMEPADGVDDFIEALELVDERAMVLHGHRHDVMPVEYHYESHPVGNPGGFHLSGRMNIIDFNTHGEETMTQVELR
jgi:hypothetical protein